MPQQQDVAVPLDGPIGPCLDQLGDVLLIDEVAAVLRTSSRTIKRSLRAGTFPIPRLHGVDKRIRFAKTDVARFLARSRT